ncbi:MAG: ppnK [Acidimicrobiia bacterium]|nr:ppnK [Acidimicrobiia bacterium]
MSEPARGALVVVHHENPAAGTAAKRTISGLRAAGYQIYVPKEDAKAVGIFDLPEPPADLSKLAVAVSVGGDGTVLRTVSMVAAASVPLLGINVGVLGYLTEVEPADLDSALERWVSGRFEVEERMMVEATVDAADQPPRTHYALNEVVVEKLEAGHTVRLLPSINGVPFTPYAADALIVSTPTGSTAYSLSARGPVLSPRMRALLLTPVAPHMLFDRTLVLGDDEEITVEVQGHRRVSLAVDGQEAGVLGTDDRVLFRASERRALFVRFARRDFHQILKAKFQLTDR